MEPVCSKIGNFHAGQFRAYHVNDGSIKQSMAETKGD